MVKFLLFIEFPKTKDPMKLQLSICPSLLRSVSSKFFLGAVDYFFLIFFIRLEGVYTRPEMKFHFAMKKILFASIFIAGEMK